MTRKRATAAVLLSALFVQLAFAVPALAMQRIYAARCCDADCPAPPGAASADRCCAIATAAAADPSLRETPVVLPADGPVAAYDAPVPPDRAASFVDPSPPGSRAAPLYLEHRSLRL